MTFPLATLIHQRRQQPRRRITPALILTAVALATATLFLTTAGAARAEETPKTSNNCTELPAVTVTAANTGSASASRATLSGNCSLSIEVRRLSSSTSHGRVSEKSTEPCIVTATPSPLGARGARVAVAHRGDCDAVRAQWSVNVGASRLTGPSRASGALSGHAAAYAKITGNEQLDLATFWNKSRVTWGYTLTTVNSASHFPSDWARGFTFWRVTGRSANLVKHGDTLYQSSNIVSYHNKVGISARTTARINAKPGGAFTCGFSGYFDPNLPLWHFDTECASDY